MQPRFPILAMLALVAAPAAAQEPPMSFAAINQHREMLLAQCPAPAPRVPEAEAASMPIHVTRWGSSGPAVLVVHGGVQGGLGGGPSTFAAQEPLGSMGWQVSLVDRPGFGQSPSRGVDDMQADAVWIADMLGQHSNLIGHSWGGAEALLAAARRPEAVLSLVLVEPAGQGLLLGDPSIDQDPALKADAMRWGAMLFTAKTPRDYALGFAHALGAVEADSEKPKTTVGALDNDPALATRFGCSLLQARMAPPPALRQAAETLARAHVPVLVITGGWSPFYDAVGVRVAALAGGKHVIVHSPNHFVQLSSAPEFNAVVDAFMRDAEKARAAQ